MEFYDVLVFLHIVSAVMWLGAGLVLEFLGWRVAAIGKKEALYELIDISDWLTPRIFKPFSLLTIGFGFWLVILSERVTFGSLWIVLAIIGVVISGFLGGGVIGKISKKISALRQGKGNEKAIRQSYAGIVLASRIDFTVVAWVLFDMVVKPRAEDVGFFVVSGIAVLVLIGLSYAQYRQGIA